MRVKEGTGDSLMSDMKRYDQGLFPFHEDRVESLVASTEALDEAASQHKTLVPNATLLSHADDYRKKGDTDLEAYFLYLADAGPRPSWCIR